MDETFYFYEMQHPRSIQHACGKTVQPQKFGADPRKEYRRIKRFDDTHFRCEQLNRLVVTQWVQIKQEGTKYIACLIGFNLIVAVGQQFLLVLYVFSFIGRSCIVF